MIVKVIWMVVYKEVRNRYEENTTLFVSSALSPAELERFLTCKASLTNPKTWRLLDDETAGKDFV